MKGVAIIGFSENSLSGSETTRVDEVWSISNAVFKRGFDEKYPNLTRIYEIHHPDFYKHPFYWREGMHEKAYYEWLTSHRHEGYEVVTLFPMPEVHNSRPYPLEALMTHNTTYAGKDDVVYSTSSAAFMILDAIYEDFDFIEIWGIDAASDEEYAHQKPCIEHALGVADGKGIKVWLHEHSKLLGRLEDLYGVQLNQAVSRKMLESFLKGHNKELNKLKSSTEESSSFFSLTKRDLDIRDQKVALQVVRTFIDMIDGNVQTIESEQMEG